MVRRYHARPLAQGVSRRRSLVDRGLRALPGHPRSRVEPAMDRVGRNRFERAKPPALDRARRELAREILFYQYLQWVADAQWRRARAAARANGVQLFGDLPFMVDGDSADVWLHQDDFSLDLSVGVPPDAFSATGQDWGMPVYRWDAIEPPELLVAAGARAPERRSLRRLPRRPSRRLLSHLRPAPERRRRVLQSVRRKRRRRRSAKRCSASCVRRAPKSSPRISASCLTSCAPRLRALAFLGSACCAGSGCGTSQGSRSAIRRSTPPRLWPRAERTTPRRWRPGGISSRRRIGASLSTVPTAGRIVGADSIDRPFDPRVRDVLLEMLFASGSDLLLLPIQDVFGWRDRINEPGTVKPENWTYRLPWPCDRLPEVAEARERQERLRAWAVRHGRR